MKTLAFFLILGPLLLLKAGAVYAENKKCRSDIALDIEGAPQGFKIYQKGPLQWAEVAGEFFTSDEGVQEFCSEAKLFTKHPQRIVVLSSTYLPWLEDLKMLDQVVGVSSKSYLANEKVHAMISEKKVTEVGLPALAERVLGLRPDLVITYRPVDREIEGVEQLNSLGLKVLELSEFKESTPLARGSWLIFLSVILGDQSDLKRAQEIWGERFKNYQSLKKSAGEFKKTPVIVGHITENAWSAPKPSSDLVQLIEDAGGAYLWSKNKGETLKGHALTLSFEKVLQSSRGAKVWLTQNQWSKLREAYQEDARYQILMNAHRLEAYNYTKDKVAGRGFDYWESGVARPDWLLRDLILILHAKDPKLENLFKMKDTKWYQKLD